MKILQLITLVFLTTVSFFGQIKGKISDKNGKPIPFATVSIEKTYIGTTSNEIGNYELTYKKTGAITLIFQSIGYKSKRIEVDIQQFPFQKDIQLDDEEYKIEEVIVKNDKNPALEIIRKAVAARKSNEKKTDKFEADFYSRGTFKAKNIPKKFMGVEIGDLDGNLDKNGNGTVYQSETVSKIKFQRPGKINEEIIASKIAGNDNGFSFNTALNTDFNFYDNSVTLGIPVVSPIASNATSYYKYKLEGFFYDEYKNQINKIKVIAKRDNEPCFDGYIYIVEDTWAIYGLELVTKGKRVNNQFMNDLKLTQNFNYNPDTKIWAKNHQIIEFSAGAFGIKFDGMFNHVFTNYKFIDQFEKKAFSNEVVKFAENANKKDNNYWETNRQVPLLDDEKINYVKKDSVYKVRNSEVYLDSVDRVKNKFKTFDILSGYTYQKSKKKMSISYDGFLGFDNISFNTVQGYNLNTKLNFSKRNEETNSFTNASLILEYGFSDEKFRPSVSFFHQFNRKNRLSISANFGNKLSQFNPFGIQKLHNTIASLMFKDNYLKLYDNTFAVIGLGKELFNGLTLNAAIGYSNRKNVFNTNFTSIIKNPDLYTSNSPLFPNDETAITFINNYLYKFSLGGNIVFDQKYISRPDAKMRVRNNDYPTVGFNYTKGFGSNISGYNYDFLSLKTDYDVQIGVKGEISLNVEAGKFFNAENVSFIDFKHFAGNQTHYLDTNWKTTFNILPYYSLSTNKQYLQAHINYDDNGFIFNKLPLLNKLGLNMLVNYHLLSQEAKNPYQEFSIGINKIGFGKFKIFRIDYVRAYQNGFVGDGLMFGLSLN